MIGVIPIAKTVVDWDSFLQLTQEGLNRNIASGLDAKRIPVRNAAGFLACLGNLVNNEQDPIRTLRSAGSLLRHISISFLVASSPDVLHQLALEARLSITESMEIEAQQIAVVSGTLEEWRNTVINGSSITASRVFRLFCNLILKEFEGMNLRIIFDEYVRREHRDDTFFLMKKS